MNQTQHKENRQKKCPACGKMILAWETACPECGARFPSVFHETIITEEKGEFEPAYNPEE